MDTSININLNKPIEHQQNNCKVRFQSNNIFDGFTTKDLPKMDVVPQKRWVRFDSLKLLTKNKNKQQQTQQQTNLNNRPLAAMSAIAFRQQQSVRRLLTTTEEEDEDDDEEDEDDEEEDTSSNSMPLNNKNLNNGRKRLMQGERKEEKMPAIGYRNYQTRTDAAKSVAAAYMAMHHKSNNISKSTTSQHATTNNETIKRRRKSKESVAGSVDSYQSKLCFFGILKIETGARLFLFFYVALSTCGVILGSIATMVWVLVPLVVVPLAIYSLSRHTSKCLYPFLVVSVIHSIVSFGMAIIVGCFSLLCFDQLKEHFALISTQSSIQHFPPSLQSSDSFNLPFFANSNSSMTAVFYCGITMIMSLVLAIFFFWQSIVLFSCISHFDLLAQQRKQHEQQLKQSTAAGGIESRVHSLASAPTDFKGGTPIVAGKCSQCISEIRQLDQFSELRGSFRQC